MAAKHGDEASTGAPATNIVVSDNGTGFVKLGYGGENFPRHVFPSLIGKPVLRAEDGDIGDVVLKDVMVGDEATKVRKYLEVSYPIENGVVKNWDQMEHLWNYSFGTKMGMVDGGATNCSGKRIMLTEAPLNPDRNKRKMMEAMFETYNFDAIQLQTQAMLTLYAQGLLTGVVLDSGDGVTHVVAVYDGFVPQNLTRRLDLAGRHVTHYFMKLMRIRGYSFNSTADFETVRQMKEDLCYVSYDFKKEMKLAEETTAVMRPYKLPDGTVIKIGHERFKCAEALFNTGLADVSQKGMSDMIFDMIQDADQDLRTDFYKHIVLSGGTTMFPGLPTRLEKELKHRYLHLPGIGGNRKLASKLKLGIEDPPRRKNMVFLGASVLSDIMKDREEFWVPKAEYDESGENAAKRLNSLRG